LRWVRSQGAAITGVELAERGVEVVASCAGGAGHQVEVLGHEKDHLHLAHQVQDALGHAVDPDQLATTVGLLSGRLLEKHDLDALQVASPLHLGHQAGEGGALLPGQPVDELAVGRGEGRAGRGQIVDGLQEVGLPLGIVALQEHDVGWQVQLQPDEIPEIGEGDMLEAHGSRSARPANALVCGAKLDGGPDLSGFSRLKPGLRPRFAPRTSTEN